MRALLYAGTGFCCSSTPSMAEGKGILSNRGYLAALAALAHLLFLLLETCEWWHYAGWRATRKSPNNILCRSAVEKHAEKKDCCFLFP